MPEYASLEYLVNLEYVVGLEYAWAWRASGLVNFVNLVYIVG